MKHLFIHYLIKHGHDENTILLASHGYDIFISDLTNFILILLIGYVTNTLSHALLFYILFAFLRSSTGGYHAKSKYTCNLTYGSIYLLFTFLYKFHFFDSFLSNVLLTTFATYFIITMSPVQHVNNPLTSEEFQTNKRNSIYKGGFMFITYISLVIFNKYISAVFSITLIYTAIFMIFHMCTKNYRRYPS